MRAHDIGAIDLVVVNLYPFEAVAKKRGCFRKVRGGTTELDLERASIMLLGDYRSGVLGRISLETPETREHMLATAPVGKKAALTSLVVADDADKVAD